MSGGGGKPVLVASDLDRTLIYSRAAAALTLQPGGDHADLVLVPVERYDDADSSFITTAAGQHLIALAAAAEFVPVTTRVPAQLARVRLPGPPPRYAVAANGGVLLIDGEPDTFWSGQVAKRLGESAPLSMLWQHVDSIGDLEWMLRLRNADDLFCYAIVDRSRLPQSWLSEISDWAAQRGWRTSLQGRKLYWVPDGLTKAAAVEELAQRLSCNTVLAAGDSLLDIDLLERADRAIMPRHGELYESGWRAAHVSLTSAAGVLAGEEISSWFLAQTASVGRVA